MSFDWKEEGIDRMFSLDRHYSRYWKEGPGAELPYGRKDVRQACRDFWSWLEDKVVELDGEEARDKVTWFDDWFGDTLQDGIDADVTSGAFGYEYGSISGTYDPGPEVEVYWDSEGEGPSLDIFVPKLPFDLDDEEMEYEVSLYDDLETFVECDLTKLEITPIELTEGDFTFTVYHVKGEIPIC